jgi:cation:H+ antiporter
MMTEILQWGPAWLWPVIGVAIGLWVLIRSSDQFVDGAAGVARHLGISPIVIGMVVVGFGTSAPEMIVSVFSALEGKPALALGNAFGSNIANIGLILGLSALIKPIQVHSNILRRELPLLSGVTLALFLLLMDGDLSRMDGMLLIILFILAISWTVWMAVKGPQDELLQNVVADLQVQAGTIQKSVLNLLIGLVLLMASSRLLVWGAVELATMAGVSELIIGLTVVAIGTSLPELASTIAAVRKGEHDLAIGNVVGSNLFNTLAVVGIASTIRPFDLDPAILVRDFPLMSVLTLSLFIIGYGRNGKGRINRTEGALLLSSFLCYTLWLVWGVLHQHI